MSTNKQILHCLKSNPFYQKIDDSKLKAFLKRVNSIDFEKIIYQKPDEFIPPQKKILLYKRMEEKKNQDWNLREILNNLEDIGLETEIERNTQIKKNREKLEKLVSDTCKKT